jgi:hypothetical protein
VIKEKSADLNSKKFINFINKLENEVDKIKRGEKVINESQQKELVQLKVKLE